MKQHGVKNRGRCEMSKKINHMNVFYEYKIHTIFLASLSIISVGIDVVLRWYSGVTIDRLSSNNPDQMLVELVLLLVGFFIVCKFIWPYFHTTLIAKVSRSFYSELERKVLTTKEVHQEDFIGASGSTIFTSDVNGITGYMSRMLGNLMPDIFTLIFSLVMIFCLNVIIGVIALVTAILSAFFLSFMSKPITKGNTQYQQNLDKLNNQISSTLYNVEFVKSNDLAEELERDNVAILCSLQKTKEQIALQEALLSAPSMLMTFLTIFSVSFVGAYLVEGGQLSLGSLFTIITLIDYVVSPIMSFTNSLAHIRRASANMERINQFMELEEECEQAQNYGRVIHDREEIFLNQLCFHYPNGKQVFQNFCASWSKGKLNIIVGENGMGKSTLVKILGEVCPVDAGEIQVPFSKMPYTKEYIREAIAIDTQESLLFADTIYHNICAGGEIPLEEVKQVCASVGIHEEIEALPDGYDTLLKSGGNPLSGGQKRRLCLARTLLRDVAIYIFDEPTTGIDRETVKGIIDTLVALSKDKTVIIITHDREMIDRAETLLTLGKERNFR